MSGRRTLYGWLTAEAVSLTGTRISMVAIPWFVLTTTGSATRTGLTAFAEMAPYVVAKAASGPWVDRVGARRVSIVTDLLSVVAVGMIPLLNAAGVLTFPWLLVTVALAGLLRGPGDGARQALVPVVVAAADVPLERATGLSGAVDRLATTMGAAVAGGIVAALGATQAIVVDAASFGVSAVLIAVSIPRTAHARPQPGPSVERPRYWSSLAEGWRFLRADAVLVALVGMIAVTNLLDAAYAAVMVPVWAEHSGGGAAAIGLLFAVSSGAAVAGSVLAATVGARLPRFATYVIAFLIAGFPRFAVLAFDVPLVVVLAVALGCGFASGFINPVIGAVIYERIPAALTGRVTSLISSLAWAGIPVGGLVGGAAIAVVGLSPALLVAGAAYLLATLLPVARPGWHDLDRRQEGHGERDAHSEPADAASPA